MTTSEQLIIGGEAVTDRREQLGGIVGSAGHILRTCEALGYNSSGQTWIYDGILVDRTAGAVSVMRDQAKDGRERAIVRLHADPTMGQFKGMEVDLEFRTSNTGSHLGISGGNMSYPAADGTTHYYNLHVTEQGVEDLLERQENPQSDTPPVPALDDEVLHFATFVEEFRNGYDLALEEAKMF